MARKSRKQPIKIDADDTCSSVGYIRLSIADKDASCSAEDQKLIIEQWAMQHKFSISHFISTRITVAPTFLHPAFKPMLADIGAAQIDCIVVKDLSRIGREFFFTSYFIEEYFHSKKVRFVSVSDRVNTINDINS